MTMTLRLFFRDRFMTLQEYMVFMISKETENVQSSEEIEMAFSTIKSQVKKSSIYRQQTACFSPEKSRPLETGTVII
jgi:hypothetical protein